MALSETTLYAPVKAFFERLGFTVKGEIHSCDVVAIRDLVAIRPGEKPIVVIAELKMAFTLELLLQAAERQASADEVWLAVAATRRGRDRDSRAHRLCRLIGLGLLAVDARGRVEVLCEAGPYRPRVNQRRRNLIVKEFTRRRGDPMEGGGNRRKVMTAYRQQALDCVEALRDGPKRPRDLRPAMPDAGGILLRNVYGWFQRVETGLYALGPLGLQALGSLRTDIKD